MMNYAWDFNVLKWRTSIYSRILILQTNNKYDIQGKRKYIKRKKKQNNIKNIYLYKTGYWQLEILNKYDTKYNYGCKEGEHFNWIRGLGGLELLMALKSTYNSSVSKTLISNLCNLRLKGSLCCPCNARGILFQILTPLLGKNINSWLSLDLRTWKLTEQKICYNKSEEPTIIGDIVHWDSRIFRYRKIQIYREVFENRR